MPLPGYDLWKCENKAEKTWRSTLSEHTTMSSSPAPTSHQKHAIQLNWMWLMWGNTLWRNTRCWFSGSGQNANKIDQEGAKKNTQRWQKVEKMQTNLLWRWSDKWGMGVVRGGGSQLNSSASISSMISLAMSWWETKGIWHQWWWIWWSLRCDCNPNPRPTRASIFSYHHIAKILSHLYLKRCACKLNPRRTQSTREPRTVSSRLSPKRGQGPSTKVRKTRMMMIEMKIKMVLDICLWFSCSQPTSLLTKHTLLCPQLCCIKYWRANFLYFYARW